MPTIPLIWPGWARFWECRIEWEEAARYYRRALKLAPDSLAIRRNLALTQWSRRRFAEAKANLEQVLARVPDDDLTRLLLGMILVNSGEYARAVSLLESVPEQVRGKGDAVAALARAQYGLGKKEQARTTLESMALNRSLPPNGVYACATVAANAEDFVTAEKLFLSIRSTYPDAAALSYQIALMQFRSNRIDRSPPNSAGGDREQPGLRPDPQPAGSLSCGSEPVAERRCLL